jgi:hypothetical protein
LNKGNDTHAWTDNHHVRVILTGKGAIAAKEKEKKARSANDWDSEANQRKRALERANIDASRKFEAYAAPLFSVAFAGLNNVEVLSALANERVRKGTTKADALRTLHAELARMAFNNIKGLDWRVREKGPVAIAKILQGVATTWGVRLPKDFAQVAQTYQPAIEPVAHSVAVETRKKK